MRLIVTKLNDQYKVLGRKEHDAVTKRMKDLERSEYLCYSCLNSFGHDDLLYDMDSDCCMCLTCLIADKLPIAK